MLFVGIRDALLIALAALIVREMWRPELDVVRRAARTTPAAAFSTARGITSPGMGITFLCARARNCGRIGTEWRVTHQ